MTGGFRGSSAGYELLRALDRGERGLAGGRVRPEGSRTRVSRGDEGEDGQARAHHGSAGVDAAPGGRVGPGVRCAPTWGLRSSYGPWSAVRGHISEGTDFREPNPSGDPPLDPEPDP
ncbi:hypothetical protein GCM10023238_02590 [Streptomyces heliomycini]